MFLFASFMGLTLGPILTYTLQLANGPQLICSSLALTGIIFFALSGYALMSKKDFSYLAGFLFAGMVIAFVAGLANIFLRIPAFQLAVSSVFVLVFSGFILFQTSQIINGGQRNYILATNDLYLAIYNLFISLLNILSMLSGRRS